MDEEDESNQGNEAELKPDPVNTDVDVDVEPIKTRSNRGRKPKPKPQIVSASVASTGSHRVFYLSGIFNNIKNAFPTYSLLVPQMISASHPSTKSWYIYATHALVNHRDTSVSMSKTNITNCSSLVSPFARGSLMTCSQSTVRFTSLQQLIRCS